MNRRTLLKLLPTVSSASLVLDSEPAFPSPQNSFSLDPIQDTYKPLEEVTIRGARQGKLLVSDGAGTVYVQSTAQNPFKFTVSGTLGVHSARLVDSAGKLLASRNFRVDCETELHEDSGQFRDLLNASLWTMMSWNQDAPVNVIRYKDRTYQFFVNWVFDHTLTLKGIKYFWPYLKDAVDFFAETQREDGMIWENCYPSTPEPNYFDWKFAYGDFVRRLEGGFRQLRRAPVESHVEQFFVEALYVTWKATGDTEWMKSKLNCAIRALRYATSNPYRWSNKYNLMHRGFTIDTWDYTSDDQQKIGSDCVFVVYPDKSEFGVFFGDNTNLVAAARRLAEMLRQANREREAPEFVTLADEIQTRLDQLSWNGNFYTHWVAENPNYRPDVGVDMSKQVALSNAYSLTRYLPHEKCTAIIKTYQRIRAEMPSTSPGEFYGIYPPFEGDFTQNSPGKVWEYVNGGVLTMVAAELAQGAFEHGFEEYAGDILLRQKKVADRYRGYLPAVLRGKRFDAPQASFRKLQLTEIANADFGPGTPGVPVWTEPHKDFRDLPTGPQEFAGIPFDIISPQNNSHRSCVILSPLASYAKSASIPVHSKAASFYLLHTCSEEEPTVGTLTIRYADGTSHSRYIQQGKNIGSWWEPHDSKYNREGPRIFDALRLAWHRPAHGLPDLGIFAAGFENPHPESAIDSLELSAGVGNSKWMVLAATLSDQPVFFSPYDDLSSGIPDGWNAAIAWTILEGLAGVKDDGVAFSRIILSPRWPAVSVRNADVTVRYPASSGYCRYRYSYEPDNHMIALAFTGSAKEFELRVLLPKGFALYSATLDGHEFPITTQQIEQSAYAVTHVSGKQSHNLTIALQEVK